jgi:hypothetical protein
VSLPQRSTPCLGSAGDLRLASTRADIECWLAQDRAADPSAAAPASGLQADPRQPQAGPRQPSQPAPARLSTVLIGALASAWLRRPAQAPVQVGLAVLEGALSPLARRHPWALIATAAGVGAALGLARPWRWLLRPALLAGLVTPLVSQLALRCLRPPSTRADGAVERDVAPPTH